MNWFPVQFLVLYRFLVQFLLIQLSSGLPSPPAPVNVSIWSQNFHHVLQWSPGPGGAPGTQYQYQVWKGVPGRDMKRVSKPTNQTTFQLKLDPDKDYYLAVEALYNNISSPMSSKIPFNPATDTIIGPPAVSLAGCDACIQGIITLPDFDIQQKHQTIDFDPTFRVMWRKEEESNEQVQELKTRDYNFTLKNLEKGVEYCVQVKPKIRINQNTRPSNWTCSTTSPTEPESNTLVVGVVTGVLVPVFVALGMAAFCLHYTGFICKLKKAMPRGLMMGLWQDPILTHNPILTPDRTVSDQISIRSSEGWSQRKPVQVSPPSTGDADSDEDDEEEEERINLYMDRDPELSSAKGSPLGSAHPELEVLKDSGSLTMEELQVDETRPEGAASLQEVGPAVVQVPITDEEEVTRQVEAQDVSGNINLFSVTLASLAPRHEEEQQQENSGNSFTDFLRVCSLNSLNRDDSGSLNPEGRESGSDSRCVDTWIHPEEEEKEEEEFSGYLTHR